MSIVRKATGAGALAGLLLAGIVAAQPAVALTGNLQCQGFQGHANCNLYKAGKSDFYNEEWVVNGADYASGTSSISITCQGSFVSVGVSYQETSGGSGSEFTRVTCQ